MDPSRGPAGPPGEEGAAPAADPLASPLALVVARDSLPAWATRQTAQVPPNTHRALVDCQVRKLEKGAGRSWILGW